MTEKYLLPIFLLLVISFTTINVIPVFAVDPIDSPQWQSKVNYANVQAKAPWNCSGYGNDADNDGICDNWESAANPGLHISFSSSTLQSARPPPQILYGYNLSCNTHATYVPNTNDPQNVVDPTGLTVCPSPNTKDIYVELDWMTGQEPDLKAIGNITQAFAKQNIALHIQFGEDPSAANIADKGDIKLHYCNVNDVILTSPPTNGQAGQFCDINSQNWQSYPDLKSAKFGTVLERSGADQTICPNKAVPNQSGIPPATGSYSYNCLTAKRQVFHYAMMVDYQFTDKNSSGWAETPGNDFFVSLGSFSNGKGNIDEQAASIMHELGHNLGLHHGGMASPTGNDEDNNCKPNYLSIMSYTYEFRKSFDICRPLDYSGNVLSPELNPSSLSETSPPITSSTYPSDNQNPPEDMNSSQQCPTSGERQILWGGLGPNNNLGSTTGGSWNDWNNNGVQDTTSYSQNLNNLGITECSSTAPSTLTGFNDWDFIKNGNSGNTAPLSFRAYSNFVYGTPPADSLYGHEVGPENATHARNVTREIHPTMDIQYTPVSHGEILPPEITMPSSGSTITTTLITISGTSIPDAKINLYSSTASIGTTTADSSGKWSEQMSLENGPYSVTATAVKDALISKSSSSVSFMVSNTPPPGLPFVYAAIIIGVITILGIISIKKSK